MKEFSRLQKFTNMRRVICIVILSFCLGFEFPVRHLHLSRRVMSSMQVKVSIDDTTNAVTNNQDNDKTHNTDFLSQHKATSEESTTIPIQSETTYISSFLLLNFVAILWGTQHKSNNRLTLENGLELGIWTFLGFACQAIGLETTTASRSAFLLYLNVKFVPFLAAIFLGREIAMSTWISAALALSGTFLLSNDGGPMNTGDMWCIVAALFSAVFILRLEKFSIQNNAAELNAASFATVAFLCAIWVLVDGVSLHGTVPRTELIEHFTSTSTSTIAPMISSLRQ
eukprot:gene8014-16412_t